MLNRLYNWYGKRVVRAVLGVLCVLVAVGAYLALRGDTPVVSEETKKLPEVTVQSVALLGETSTFTVVGTVRAVSEAKLQAEAGGRITAVNVKIGDIVRAGTILGSIENSSEQARLLQAEGAYESARASSEQGTVSLDEAKVGVRNTYRDTFSTADNVVLNVIDQFYSNPGKNISGFRLTGTGNATEYIAIRNSIEGSLTEWSDEIRQTTPRKDEREMLADAESTITSISNLTARLAVILSNEKDNTYLTSAERASYNAQIASARTSLNGALSSISRTRQTYEQAVLSGSSDIPSQSSAGLKAALGALRSAQVSYEKTLIRTPISGVVNSLNLTTGEFISQGQPAAIVANNGSLEVSTALGEKDLTRVHIGDTVRINNTVDGTITQIAPAIDPATGKSEVKIDVIDADALKNGSSVSVAFTHSSKASPENKDVVVPLKSLKMLASGSVAFGVSAENKLTVFPVVLGSVLGDSVQITEGLTLDTEIVTDARGLKEGDEVTVIRK